MLTADPSHRLAGHDCHPQMPLVGKFRPPARLGSLRHNRDHERPDHQPHAGLARRCPAHGTAFAPAAGLRTACKGQPARTGTRLAMSSPGAPQPRRIPRAGPAVVLITGIQAAGKSTVAQLLAERLPRSVHVRGDLFRRMVINGRADMTPEPSGEALRQLRLRHQLTAMVSDTYYQAGFTVITQDVILGEHLAGMTIMISSRPLLVVVLAPQPAAIAAREAARGKAGYRAWAVEQLDDVLRTRHPAWDSGSIPPARLQPRPWTRSSPGPGPKP